MGRKQAIRFAAHNARYTANAIGTYLLDAPYNINKQQRYDLENLGYVLGYINTLQTIGGFFKEIREIERRIVFNNPTEILDIKEDIQVAETRILQELVRKK